MTRKEGCDSGLFKSLFYFCKLVYHAISCYHSIKFSLRKTLKRRNRPVWAQIRIGGDEFAVALEKEDLQNRDELMAQFYRSQEETNASVENPWEKAHVSVGIAVYDPQIDHCVIETVRRADKIMYENKRLAKNHTRGQDPDAEN